MFKRIGLFLLTNILVVTTISIITNLLGVRHYMDAYGINYTSLIIFCSIWGMAGAFISLLLSKTMAKWTMGLKMIDPRKASGSERELLSRVETLSRMANIPMPEVGYYESAEVNAFATGPSKSNSLVAVSTGLLNRMNSGELDGVLAHEISHVANGDMVTMTLIQGVVNSFAMFFSRIISFAISNMVKEEMAYMVRIISTIVLDIAFTILGSIVVAYFSRIREYRADAGGAKLAGKSNMIGALESLKRTIDAPVDPRGEALASFKISSNKGNWLALFASHPSLDDRIQALKKNY